MLSYMLSTWELQKTNGVTQQQPQERKLVQLFMGIVGFTKRL